MENTARSLAEARDAKEKAKEIFRGLGSVNGIGLTRQGDRYAVRVSFEAEPQDWSRVPKDIGGVPVVVRVIGPLHKQTA